MEQTPHDLIFKVFYFLGYLYIIGAFLAGSYITYDWIKNRRKSSGQD